MASSPASYCRRLRAQLSQLAAAAETTAAPARQIVFEEVMANQSGDAQLAAQGFGRRAATQPPKFTPHQTAEIVEFFHREGYVVVLGALSSAEVAHLNDFYVRTQSTHARAWGLGDVRQGYHKNQGLIYSQPLLDHPELDVYTQHPGNYPVVCELLGGADKPRFQEFNFRESPEGAGQRAMNFHRDRSDPSRLTREVYGAPDWLCAVHYVTDVTENTPAFAVVPRSVCQATLRDAFENGAAEDEDGRGGYVEQPLYGPAGTCVLYDTATFHARLDGKDDTGRMRRTMHQYYARGGWSTDGRGPTGPLTDWNVFPRRLAASDDPGVRKFFSSWNTAMCEWAASGWSDEVRQQMPRGYF